MKKVLYLLSIGVITLLTLNSCSKDEELEPRFFFGEYVGNCNIEYYDSEGVHLHSMDEVGVDCSVRVTENVKISNEILIYLEIGPGRNIQLSCVTDDLDCGTDAEKIDRCRLKERHPLTIKDSSSSFDKTTFSDFNFKINKKDGVFELYLYLGSKNSTKISVQAYK